MMVEYCFNTSQDSSYLRLTSIPCDIPYQLPDNYVIQKGQGCLVKEGKDILLIAYGPVMLSSAYRAADYLDRANGDSISVLNLPWLNTLDTVWFEELLNQYKLAVVVDDHYEKGGLGEFLGSIIAKSKMNIKVAHLGISHIPCCGVNDEALEHHGVDMMSIVECITKYNK